MIELPTGLILLIIGLILILSSTITNIVNYSKNFWWWQTRTPGTTSYNNAMQNSSSNFGASISSTIGAISGWTFILAGTILMGLDYSLKNIH
jgi:hypothetical protein